MSRSFNGTTDYLSYAGAVDAGHPMSFALWFNKPTTNFRAAFSIGNASQSLPNRNVIILASNARALSSNAGNTTVAFAQSTANFSLNTWHHACAVFSSNSSRTIYLDGGNSATNTTTVSVSAGTFNTTTIGAVSSSGGPFQYCDGSIAEVAVWNTSLTADDAASLASGISPMLVRPDVLVAYWPLFGEASPEIDIIRGQDATVNGATAGEHPRILRPRMPGIYLAATSAGPVIPVFYHHRQQQGMAA